MFSAELQGMEVAKQGKLEELVMGCLTKLAETGFSSEEIESALHQLELRRRHIGGDGLPFGLGQCLRATGVWCCNGDVLAALDQDSALKRLREVAGKVEFWPSFIQDNFIDNQHRVIYASDPDLAWAEKEQADELAMIQDKLAQLDDATIKTELAALDKELDRRQQEGNDPSCLPQIALEDVPLERHLSMAIGLNRAFVNSPPPPTAC